MNSSCFRHRRVKTLVQGDVERETITFFTTDHFCDLLAHGIELGLSSSKGDDSFISNPTYPVERQIKPWMICGWKAHTNGPGIERLNTGGDETPGRLMLWMVRIHAQVREQQLFSARVMASENPACSDLVKLSPENWSRSQRVHSRFSANYRVR
jgi:hypothetical protein